MIPTQEIYDLSKQLESEISNASSVLGKYPVNKYVEFIDNYPTLAEYNHLSPELKKYTNGILEQYGTGIMELYHKQLLLTLIIKSTDILPQINLPEEVKKLYYKDFKRILDNLQNEKLAGFYLYPSDAFFKKLAVCSLRLIPVGARKINQSKLPIKKFIFKNGTRQFIDVLLFIMMELKGIMPLYIGHLDTNDPDLVAELNEDGLKKTYFRIVELMKINESIKGYFGTSWMLDPHLDQINHRHRYSREIVTRNGGKLYYKGPSKAALKNALKTSQTRRRWYEAGKYIPTDYVIVWSRKKLFEWAEKNSFA